jgi:Flp pilus assembly protein TadG
MRGWVKQIGALLSGDESDGVAAVEFAMVTPVFIVLLAGAVDLSGLVIAHFHLEAAVAAASNYALLNNAQVSSSGGASLASNVASVVTSVVSTNATVVVNDGPTATVSGGTTTTSGTAANADLCYCPTGTPTNLTWGNSVTCGSACAAGGTAGKFVLVTASYTYSAMFTNYNFINGGVVTSGAMVQTQ